MSKTNHTLVIMAAGLASRYGGGKQVAHVGPNGEILMEYAIFDALRAGFDKIVVVIRPEMLEDMKALFADRIEASAGVHIHFAFQEMDRRPAGTGLSPTRTKPLGTVHALLCAKEEIDGPFAVINADDFYGKNAFAVLSAALPTLRHAGESAMVAYLLKNTVSQHGSVTRGICQIENGKLQEVTETFNVRLFPDSTIRDTSEKESGRPLDPNRFVSMNMWGFSQDILPRIEEYFAAFLHGLQPEDNASECLLPVMVDDFIAAGVLETQVLTTSDKWYGLTNRADREDVAAELPKLHSAGIYPQKLW